MTPKPRPYRWLGPLALVAALLAVYAVVFRPPPPSGIGWLTDPDAAQVAVMNGGKPLLLYFTASWCAPCRQMKFDTWPDPRVEQRVNERFVPLMLDVDTPAGRRLMQSYGVGSIPTLIIADAAGNALGSQEGYLTADELLTFLGAP